MRYLGLPLISTRLFIRDCKRLVDKVRKRIGDWRNKFLSYSGRLQLISSVLFSFPVYWASSMLIPMSVIKEIEKMMKNFLWNHDESKKGRAKVAWSAICKPVANGGLGLRSLRMWNKAILSKRIWMILSDVDSLWVKWVKFNLLKGRSFWDVEKKNGLSWSWRNLIKLKSVCRDHFCNVIGNGEITYMWYDDWHPLGPFSYVLSPREITSAGFNISDKVKDVVIDSSWFWPEDWCNIIPQLKDHQLPILDDVKTDKVMWRNNAGKEIEFSIKKVCDDLYDLGNKVSWVHLVWFKHSIPSHSFILWLAIQERLLTQDRMRFWDKKKNLNCVFCNTQQDSHSHLFFECPYSSSIWDVVKDRVEIRNNSSGWKELVEDLMILFKGNNISIFIMKIAFAATVYHVWKERNSRLFRKGKNMEEKIILNIFEEIRLKLIGLKGDFLGFDNEVKRKWGVPVGKKNHDYSDMGLIPIIGCFPPWQLGVSTSVGATASSISKWWDNHPVIPRIGYVFLKLYHIQGYFWNIPIKKGIDGFLILGVVLKKSVGGMEFFDLEDCGFSDSMSSFFVRRWFIHQGYFRNFWFIPLEEFLKINWNSLCKKEFGEKLKNFWKWWILIGHFGFSNILSWNLKIFALVKEDIGKFVEDLIDNFRNCFKNFEMDNGLNFWSIWVIQVKIGKKLKNWFLEKVGKYCMKSKAQSSKLIAIIGSSPVWRIVKFYDGLIDLANDSLDLEVPWMFCKIDIIQTLDYLVEYEAIFWDLVWWRFKGYLKIEDFEDFTRWKIFDMELIVYFFGSYDWFHSLLWSWTWKWISWCLLDRSFCPLKILFRLVFLLLVRFCS
uniref:Reverse transcriptase zinc-binding domain-containing protein n=1 Tax=Lactuca sativa TaxID=4236 RepID=A0A9R1WCK8_LACSA|nr:hypothetical protein LSAT_V11C200101220 [Lactuca sativa]